MIKVLVHSKNQKKTYDLSSAINGALTYITQQSTASKITFEVIKKGDMNFHEGDRVSIYQDNNLWVVGYIFSKSKNQERIKVTAYDSLRYLQYNQSYNFKNVNASKIIRKIALEFGIEVGEIEDTNYILPQKLYEDKTLIDIISDALMITSVNTGKVYILFDEKGKLTLKEVSNMKSKYIIGNKSFGIDYTYDTSIEETYNYIKLVRPNKNTGKADTYIAKDSSTTKKWGRLQMYKKVDENMNPAQIKDLAEKLLKSKGQVKRSVKIEALGISEIRAGSMVLIDIADLGDIALKKMLLIDKCTHKIESNSHTMNLEARIYG